MVLQNDFEQPRCHRKQATHQPFSGRNTVTQEFHLSVTPIRDNDYLVRTEYVAPGVPLAEEQVTWYVDDWLTEARLLMGDPVMGLLRSSGATGLLNSELSRSPLTNGEPPANLVAFGQRLFNALFQGTIRDSWMMAQGIAQHQHHRLRFRLGLKGTQLHRLPWEVLYAGDRPLATGTDVIFSRYHSSFSVLRSHLTLPTHRHSDPNQPLKILLVLAAPNDQDVLALKQEAEQLRQELRTVSDENSNQIIELTILEQPGREHLTQALEHNHFHVLHYAGHSDLGEAGGNLYLVNNRTGLTEVMNGDDLAGLLVNNGIRMAVFNSCRGVYTATASTQPTADGNLAESLVRRGIPAVLAMAERIPDNVALNLSRLFYRNLRQAYPLDLSLSRTRQGLISSYGSDKLYWALPILYLHPEFDGFLQPTTAATTLPAPASQDYGDFYATADAYPFTSDRANTRHHQPTPQWPTEFPQGGSQNGRSQPDQELLEFDELEFDDPDPPEEEQVARLVQELSQSPTLLEPAEPMLPAAPDENLLPSRQPNGKVPNFQPPTARQPATPGAMPRFTPPPLTGGNQTGETEVYSELTAVLADMGTLTPAIADGSRAVQENPGSAAAYANLGWALYQQGYLTEAISAYNQAIRLNPHDANAFSRIGLAYFQQGKVEEAVRAYHQAVKLDPTLTEASTNLRNALYGPHPSPPTAPCSPSAAATQARVAAQRVWLWVSLGTIALAVGAIGWVYRENLRQLLPPPAPAPSLPAAPAPSTSLNTLDPVALTTLAQAQLQQGKVAEAQPAIEALLINPNNHQTVEQLLQSVPAAIATQPEIAFLQGLLLWRQLLAGENNASLEKVRQLWEQAAQAAPTPRHQNALGFAYYEERNIERAEESWLAALRFAGGALDPAQVKAPMSREMLTALAGLALTAENLAAQQADATKQATLRAEAIQRRQRVLQNDAVNFSPEKLRMSLIWSEKAIRDWEALLKQ